MQKPNPDKAAAVYGGKLSYKNPALHHDCMKLTV